MSARRGMQSAGRFSGTATASSPPSMASVPVKRSVEDNGAEPAKKRIAALNDPLGAQLPAMEGGPPSSSRTRRGKTFGEVVPIPYGLVGLISRIQAETGCKVQVAPDSGGGKDRPCYLEGTKQAIERAKILIADMISSNDHEIEIASSGPGPSKPTNGHASIEILIPGAKISLVIGKDGETIRSLQDKSGTRMFILQDYMFEDSDKTLRIVGHPDLVDNAMQLVIDLIHKSSPESKKPNNQMKTGAKVQFDPISSNLEDTDERCVIITRKRAEELVETALQGDKGDNFSGRDQGDERRNGALVNIDEESKYFFPCYECGGEKFEDIVKHRYNKHSFIKDCPFCAGAEFERRGGVSEHINRQHRIQTGLWKPAATVISNPDPENINLEQELQEMKQSKDWKIVVKKNFAVLYDESIHTPIICIERLTASNLQRNYRDDDAKFYTEELLEKNVCPQGFPSMKPAMNAGHLAARANHTNSKEAFLNTFSTLNIVPMDPSVNCGVWSQIEKHSRKLVSYWHDVVVLSGPIYDLCRSIPQLNPVGLYVHAPTAFFKLVVMRRFEEEPKVQAFITENDYKPSETFHQRATIKDIAARTGLNLLKYEKYAYTWDMKNESFICNKKSCYETFLSQTDLDVHKLVPHCSICGCIFDEVADLNAHQKSHPKITCPDPDCDHACFTKQHFTGHMQQVHSTERPFACQEEGCNFKFKSKSLLNSHTRAIHYEDRPYLCTVSDCGKAFKRQSQLNRHTRADHYEERPYLCTVSDCGKAFKRQETLDVHTKSVHKNERPYVCTDSDCGKAFNTKTQLNTHTRALHNDEVPHICTVPDCGKTFQTKSQLNRHTRADHYDGRPYLCTISDCGKAFKTKETLDRHTTVHYEERPYLCTVSDCGKAFKRQNALVVHKKAVHKNERPYVCTDSDCGLAFQSKNSLEEHIKIAHYEGPFFSCTECKKEYKFKRNLQRHVKTSHGGKAQPDPEKKTTNNGTMSAKASTSSCVTKKDARPGILKLKYVDETEEKD